MDIYLVDQVLRGRIPPGSRILDAGCGNGRNLDLFLARGDPVVAVDREREALTRLRERGARWASRPGDLQLLRAALEGLPLAPEAFDTVLAVAVLHFLPGEAALARCLEELWRVLRPGGLLFMRLASSIGMEDRVRSLGDRVHRLPDGSRRLLVDQQLIEGLTASLGARLADPIKTTVVADQRSMTTWSLFKP